MGLFYEHVQLNLGVSVVTRSKNLFSLSEIIRYLRLSAEKDSACQSKLIKANTKGPLCVKNHSYNVRTPTIDNKTHRRYSHGNIFLKPLLLASKKDMTAAPDRHTSLGTLGPVRPFCALNNSNTWISNRFTSFVFFFFAFSEHLN